MNLHSYCFQFVKNNRSWSVSNFFLILLNYPLEMVVISYLSGQIFTRLPNIKTKYNSLLFLFILIFIAYIVIEASITIKDRIDVKYFPKLEREVRLGVVDIILNKINVSYDNVKTGEIVSRLLKAPIFVSLFFTNFNKYVLPFFITMAITCVYLFYLNPKIGAIGTLAILIYLVIFSWISIKSIDKVTSKESKENALLEDVDDTLNNSMSIISAGLSKTEQQRLAQLHDHYDEKLRSQLKASTLVKWVGAIINVFLFAVLIGFTLFFYKKNQLSSATAISLITLTLFLVKHLRTLSRRVAESFVYFGTLKENNQFLKSLETSPEQIGHIKNLEINGNIRFQNVSFTYPNTNKKSLHNISFSINAKDKIAIIGKSGSGKSTILKLILGLYQTQEGTIFINNQPINNINKDYLRSKISTVNQNIKLFNRTIMENIAYGTNKSHKEITEKLQQLDIMKVFHNLPNGLNSNVGKYGDKLSGGQKQIIYLLRCYFRNNPIIILDEPTSSIDVYHKQFVLKMINELSKKSTLIIVSHDPTIYSKIPKKIFINEGRIISNESSLFQPF